MTDLDQETSPASAFAALMSGASEQADVEAAEAPYGYTKTGAPRKAPGRPRKPPSLDELKEAADPGPETENPETATEPASDRAPDESPRRVRGGRKKAADAPAPPYRAGVIATGVNRLYRRAGKIVRPMDHDIGTAIIESARNTAEPGEPDDSVGAAWDELARTNPRVRKFLLKCIAGGAWGQLVMAHAPIAMAIIMKPAILRLIPFRAFIESLAEPDEDTAEGEGGLPGGMTAADAQQMADLAAQQMTRMGMSISPETAAQMAAMAQGMMGSPRLVPSGSPGSLPAQARNQPRRPANRASRKKAG
jgi:hypothetical protein